MNILSEKELALVKLSMDPKQWALLVDYYQLFRPIQYSTKIYMDEIEFIGITCDGFSDDSDKLKIGVESSLGRMIGVWKWAYYHDIDPNYQKFVIAYTTGHHPQMALTDFETRALRDEFLEQDQPFTNASMFRFILK